MSFDASLINVIRKRRHRILIIDDDASFRKSLCFKLERKYKAQVEEVDCGESGLEKLRDGNSYNFVFLDIMMPRMTGIQTYFELRRINGSIPIVLMSAHFGSREWEQARELKEVPLLHKPISDDRLNTILSA